MRSNHHNCPQYIKLIDVKDNLQNGYICTNGKKKICHIYTDCNPHITAKMKTAYLLQKVRKQADAAINF